ncbi:MAG: ribosome silencing factor [Eubacteriales bacterium]
MEQNTKTTALAIAEILQKKGATDIQLIDVTNQTIITDYFLIATGKNVPNVKALTEEVKNKMEKNGRLPRRTEGVREARWVVMDYQDVLLHIFHKDERAFYGLEKLWADGDNVEHL